MEEVFDVVDARDQVTGSLSRSEVHRLGLRHRAVHVFVFNRAGQVFLQKRSRSKDSNPGHWDSSVSGHVDSGEDYDTAARREFGEELGIEAPPLQRMFYVEAQPVTGQEFCWVYSADCEGPFKLHPDEIDDGIWLDPSAVESAVTPLSPCFHYLWKVYLDWKIGRGERIGCA